MIQSRLLSHRIKIVSDAISYAAYNKKIKVQVSLYSFLYNKTWKLS